MFVIVRTSGASLSLMPSVREAVRAPTPGCRFRTSAPCPAHHGLSVLRRVISWLFGLPAGGALMAFAGLYGVISYPVSRRIQEIGVRVALGARIPDVTGMIVRQGLRLIAVAWPSGWWRVCPQPPVRQSAGMLYHVSPNDP